MIEFLKSHLEDFVQAALIISMSGWGIFAYAWDRQKARYIEHRLIMTGYLAKARSDRNDKARIPADKLSEMFDLHEPTIANWKRTPMSSPHPALKPRRQQ